jgi:hypothetical protein
MPHNRTGWVNLDDAVVELISDKNIARMIKSMMLRPPSFGNRDPGTA